MLITQKAFGQSALLQDTIVITSAALPYVYFGNESCTICDESDNFMAHINTKCLTLTLLAAMTRLHNVVIMLGHRLRRRPSINPALVELCVYCAYSVVTLIAAILWNSMTSTSFAFTELANTIKYGGGFLYNHDFTEWRHCVSQIRERSLNIHLPPPLVF